MEGQFLVRQIYDDEITYGLIGAAVEILSELFSIIFFYFFSRQLKRKYLRNWDWFEARKFLFIAVCHSKRFCCFDTEKKFIVNNSMIYVETFIGFPLNNFSINS